MRARPPWLKPCVALHALLLTTPAWAATGQTVEKLVKSGPDNLYIYPENGHEAPATESCSCSVTKFTPRTVNVGAAPEAAQTTNPVSASLCFSWDGAEWVWPLTFNFPSLHDVGTWTITCNGKWFNPDYCTSAAVGCGLYCNPYLVSDWPNAFVWTYNVKNSPPTASIGSSGTPAWNAKVTLLSNANDPDHGTNGLHYFWGINAHPPASTVSLSSTSASEPTIQFTGEHDIGTWTFSLSVDDQENERFTASAYSFDVPNAPPTILTNPASPITIDGGRDISITAAVSDPDGGPTPSVVWDIVSSPPGASLLPQSSYATGEVLTPIPTGKRDIGAWQIDITATDNEGETANPSGKVTEHLVVDVVNQSPEIHFNGSPAIHVGENLHVDTSPLTDFFGDDLQFSWEVVQVPHSAGVPLHTIINAGLGAAGASLDIPITTAIDAGTWIFKLTVTETGVDPSIMPSPVVSDTFAVLIDAPPIANIAVSAAGPLVEGDPPTIGTGSFPLTLDASGSVDPDSPCPADPNHCHDTDMPPAKVSPGIKSYLWKLADVSPELQSLYTTGRIDENFGIDGTSATVVFNALDLLPGDLDSGQFTFEVEVTDDEGNTAKTRQSVVVLKPNTAPTAVVSAPDRYEVGLGGVDRDVVLSGANSFDRDNLLTGSLGPGVGIADYQWTATPPPGCIPPTTIPSGSGASTFTLYPAGVVPPNACLGRWSFVLNVGDDDTPQLHNSAETFMILGTCSTLLCIDTPTTFFPAAFDFSDNVRVEVWYHIDSTVYDDPTYVNGAFARLDIFDDAYPTVPFFTDFDPNPLDSGRGGSPRFEWNGWGTGMVRPSRGTYSVKITIDGSGLSAGPFATSQPQSISIAIANVVVQNSSDRFVDWAELDSGNTSAHFNYQVTGGVMPDQLHYRIFDITSTRRFEKDAPVINSGTIYWDGKIGAVTLEPGDYTFELEALRSGASLGKSARHPFTIYKLKMAPTAGPSPVPVMVNTDDDDRNNVADVTQTPAPPGEDDLVWVSLTVDPPVAGTLVLSASPMPAAFKIWSSPAKTSEIVLPKTYNLPGDTVPTQVFVEGTAAATATLTATLTPTGAPPLPAARLPLELVEIQTLVDTNSPPDFIPDTPTLFVRIGLWDFAFRLAADAFGAAGTLFNEQDDARIAAVSNPENYIARDTRSFFLQIKDPARNTNSTAVEEIPLAAVEWYTIRPDGTDDDKPPTNASLSLIETGPNTGVFVSKAVMLVTGQIDRDQPTNTGTALHPGLANYNTANHRTRQVGAPPGNSPVPDGANVLRYQPVTPGSAKLALKTPLFERGMNDERKAITVHFFNISDTPKGVAATPIATVNKEIRQLAERFTMMGFRANIVFNPLTDAIDLPAGSPVSINAVTQFTGGFGTLAPSIPDESTLIGLVRGVDPATAANADTIYVIVVPQLASNNGESFPDGWIPVGSSARNFTLIGGLSMTNNDFNAAHEIITHMLDNQTLTLAESNGTAPGWDSGGHYGGPVGRPDLPFNLCGQGPTSSVPLVVTDALRVWDDSIHIFQQITRARTATRYLKAP